MSDLDFARGLASERTRFREIVLASEAVGRERAAIELALNTELSPDAARRTLRELAGRHARRRCREYRGRATKIGARGALAPRGGSSEFGGNTPNRAQLEQCRPWRLKSN